MTPRNPPLFHVEWTKRIQTPMKKRYLWLEHPWTAHLRRRLIWSCDGAREDIMSTEREREWWKQPGTTTKKIKHTKMMRTHVQIDSQTSSDTRGCMLTYPAACRCERVITECSSKILLEWSLSALQLACQVRPSALSACFACPACSPLNSRRLPTRLARWIHDVGQTKKRVENCHISPLEGTRLSPTWRRHISEAKTLFCEGVLTCMMACDSFSPYLRDIFFGFTICTENVWTFRTWFLWKSLHWRRYSMAYLSKMGS